MFDCDDACATGVSTWNRVFPNGISGNYTIASQALCRDFRSLERPSARKVSGRLSSGANHAFQSAQLETILGPDICFRSARFPVQICTYMRKLVSNHPGLWRGHP